jgi:hypothetical protein
LISGAIVKGEDAGRSWGPLGIKSGMSMGRFLHTHYTAERLQDMNRGRRYPGDLVRNHIRRKKFSDLFSPLTEKGIYQLIGKLTFFITIYFL